MALALVQVGGGMSLSSLQIVYCVLDLCGAGFEAECFSIFLLVLLFFSSWFAIVVVVFPVGVDKWARLGS